MAEAMSARREHFMVFFSGVTLLRLETEGDIVKAGVSNILGTPWVAYEQAEGRHLTK
jgi:hypothetical protein